jgi:hypothetical protein
MFSQSSSDSSDTVDGENLVLVLQKHVPDVFDVGSRVGLTGYIDYIYPVELKQSSIARGIDIYQRPFVVMRGYVLNSANGFKHDFMQTFFQRYTGSPNVWVGCGHGGPRHLMHTDGGINVFQSRLLVDIITNGYASIPCSVIAQNDFKYRLIGVSFSENDHKIIDDTYTVTIRLTPLPSS